MKKINIAIDGPSSAGKSTMARELARHIGYMYIDSGAMYRAVTLYALQNGILRNGILDEEALCAALPEITVTFVPNPSTGLPDTFLNGINVEHGIRSMEVSGEVSRIAAISPVRRAMVDRQQAMGRRKGMVMDGRDIGSVVFPDAELKIFVTAPPEVRARRRYDELIAKGVAVDYEEVLRNVRERDRMDTTRKDSPLIPLPDACILDNAALTADTQLHLLLQLYQARIKSLQELSQTT
ncbi:MAG: (d)CMP kinase [Tannerellaceae bacterium]|jgi:cytidylate kinase|nr:(d)CMP kinase [Tannerellaceae bacterium]